MTTWDEYLNQIDEEVNDDSPIYSSVSVNTGLILNGNLQQSAGEIQATGLKLDSVSLTTIQTGSESFVDNDTSLMTSAAIQDKIESYGYSTTTGDITGVTAGSGLSGGGTSGTVELAVADLAISHFAGATIQTGSEAFNDNDTSLMTSAAVQDKIEGYGYITGVTNISGNAATATALQTARNIGGVSFDGTGNIDLAGVNTAGNQNTSGNAATATALETARTIGGVSFNGTANINLAGVNTAGNQDTTGNAATATALETARTIGGVSFDGTGNINLAGVNTAGNQDTSGNAATATILATARNIAGTSFNGSANIDIDANNLSGSTLNSGVTASSLTSVGTLTGLTISTEQSTTSGVEYLLTLKSTDADDSLNLVAGSGVGISFHTPAGTHPDATEPSYESGRIQVVKNSDTDDDDAARMEFWTGTGDETGVERAMYIDEVKRLHLLGTEDVSLTSSPTGILILGNSAGNHMQIDDNEIYAKSDATTARTLHLQTNGGYVHIAGGPQLTKGANDVLEIKTSSKGELDVGCMNTSGAHYYTDRIRHYWGYGGTAKFALHAAYFYPLVDNYSDLGTSSYRWDDVRATNPYIQTSDSRDKKDIADIDLGLSFINDLRPVTFKWNDRSGYVGTRTHMGFIAQEVASTLGDLASDRALWTDTPAETMPDGDGIDRTGVDRQGLRGGELIPPIVKAIQELSARVTTLEG